MSEYTSTEDCEVSARLATLFLTADLTGACSKSLYSSSSLAGVCIRTSYDGNRIWFKHTIIEERVHGGDLVSFSCDRFECAPRRSAKLPGRLEVPRASLVCVCSHLQRMGEHVQAGGAAGE